MQPVKYLNSNSIYFGLWVIVALSLALPMLINNIAIILLLSFWLFLLFKGKLEAPQLRTLLIFMIPYIILLIGIINTSNYNQLQTELTKNLPFILFPLILFTAPYKITSTKLKTIFKAFVLGNIIICLILLFVILKKVVMEGYSNEILWQLTHQKLAIVVKFNAIYLSLFLSICVVIILYYFLFKNKTLSRFDKVSSILSLILFVIVLIFLSSRTVLLALGIVVSAMFLNYLILNKFPRRFYFLTLFVANLLVVGMFMINPVLKMRVQSIFLSENSYDGFSKEEGLKMREKLWGSSLEVYKSNWLLGVGTGDFKDELLEIYKKNKYIVQYRFNMNSHNQYLSILVSNGIIGFVFFIYYLAYSLKRYAKHKAWLYFFICSLFILCFITESYLYTNKGVVIVSFFITFLYKSFLDSKNSALNETS